MFKDQLPINEYADFYARYITALENIELFDNLEIKQHEFIHFVQNVPLGKHDYRYAPGKWTLKDIIQHIIDAERVFAYRALRIGRGDQTALPGYDENLFAENTNANNRHLQELLTEFALVRQSTLALFKSFKPAQLQNVGTASDKAVSVRALGFIILGHQQHHINVFKERYLDENPS
ncbi:DinB family protein [Flavobacterium aurantiibacter]|uniref:Damage-inducible protein DinB n=1 Tax=Flavobacterium aurantiibacter TaxID=2023067 RepID=A0A255ZZW9_9FLAO|nr:DinB family protein [Flavobacterium aurantiibacter]OYQ46931.1 damage-inducible protein DinB [Flavobacterium aurantiibacter]